MVKYRRNFFDNKFCSICKKPARIFRKIKNKPYLLCNSQKCDYITRIRAGYFNEFLNLKG